jgi:hypothetical protein
VPQPQPGQLDHGRAHARVAGLADALLAARPAARPRARRQAGVLRDLAPVGEAATEDLRLQHARDVRADAA